MKVIDGIRFAKKYAPVPLTEWQLDILHGIFANRFSMIVLPSGYGKTLMAALNVSARLFCEHKRIRSFGVSGDLEQAGLLSQTLDDICEHPDLRSLVIKKQWRISLRQAPKSVHETLASHAATAWGRTPNVLTCDELSEATAQSEQNFFAMVSALRKQQHSSLVIITSPSLVDSTAHRILENVRGDPKWFVCEHTSDDIDAPWLDTDSEDVYDSLLPFQIRQAKHKGIWTSLGGNVLSQEKIDQMFEDVEPDLPVEVVR